MISITSNRKLFYYIFLFGIFSGQLGGTIHDGEKFDGQIVEDVKYLDRTGTVKKEIIIKEDANGSKEFEEVKKNERGEKMEAKFIDGKNNVDGIQEIIIYKKKDKKYDTKSDKDKLTQYKKNDKKNDKDELIQQNIGELFQKNKKLRGRSNGRDRSNRGRGDSYTYGGHTHTHTDYDYDDDYDDDYFSTDSSSYNRIRGNRDNRGNRNRRSPYYTRRSSRSDSRFSRSYYPSRRRSRSTESSSTESSSPDSLQYFYYYDEDSCEEEEESSSSFFSLPIITSLDTFSIPFITSLDFFDTTQSSRDRCRRSKGKGKGGKGKGGRKGSRFSSSTDSGLTRSFFSIGFFREDSDSSSDSGIFPSFFSLFNANDTPKPLRNEKDTKSRNHKGSKQVKVVKKRNPHRHLEREESDRDESKESKIKPHKGIGNRRKAKSQSRQRNELSSFDI